MSRSTPGALVRGDRQRVRVLAVVSVVMITVIAVARMSAPSPFAPRVHVRWVAGLSDAERVEVERRFSLVAGRHREDMTWQYELADPTPVTVRALVRHPAIADTHYIERAAGTVSKEAPRGTTRLAVGSAIGWVHSPLFDWFMVFWVTCLIVSFLWLEAAAQSDRAQLRDSIEQGL